MSETARVFVSATSVDLGSYRRIVSDTLLKLDAQPVTQDHFAPDSRAVKQMLRDRIAACDAVICLVGAVYGHEPKQHDDGPRRSFTQLEYDIAVELRKQQYITLALACLTDAVAAGFNDFDLIRTDKALTILRDLPAFKKLLPEPAD